MILRRIALSSGVLLAACRPSSPPPAGPVEPAASAPASSAPAAEAPAASASASPAATRPGDGCWGLSLPADPKERLLLLGQRCAQGMKPLLPEPRQLSADGPLALPALPPGACLRAAAAGNGASRLALLDGDALLASDQGSSFALLDAAGPVCPRKREGLRLKLADAQGAAWVQVWVATRNVPPG